eukprot:TRINITY_DN14864_c2_g1_i1.p1 TRINITY_DN14864_c2_g1~~TRINITY_DN14864_c2_g1_i1.p1  ORF type:complete len:406 (+),score=22.27 TRINITY_DN14864_c2_g1_i1:49-1218(+)
MKHENYPPLLEPIIQYLQMQGGQAEGSLIYQHLKNEGFQVQSGELRRLRRQFPSILKTVPRTNHFRLLNLLDLENNNQRMEELSQRQDNNNENESVNNRSQSIQQRASQHIQNGIFQEQQVQDRLWGADIVDKIVTGSNRSRSSSVVNEIRGRVNLAPPAGSWGADLVEIQNGRRTNGSEQANQSQSESNNLIQEISQLQRLVQEGQREQKELYSTLIQKIDSYEIKINQLQGNLYNNDQNNRNCFRFLDEQLRTQIDNYKIEIQQKIEQGKVSTDNEINSNFKGMQFLLDQFKEDFNYYVRKQKAEKLFTKENFQTVYEQIIPIFEKMKLYVYPFIFLSGVCFWIILVLTIFCFFVYYMLYLQRQRTLCKSQKKTKQKNKDREKKKHL